jgi:hypothetical protein
VPDEQAQANQSQQANNQSASGGQNQSQSATGSGAQAGASQGTQSSQDSTPTPIARPEYIPEAHWDAATSAPKPTFGDYVKENVAFKAAQDSRRLTLPQKPEDYKFGLSPEFKPPQGIEFKLDEKDPLVGQYRQFALTHGLDQAAFTKGLDLIAAVRLGDAQSFETAKADQLGKLGVNAPARITAVTQWLSAMAGDKAAAMVKVLEMAPMASTVEAFETIMQKATSQGMAPFNGGGRTQKDTTVIPNYEGMTFEQRRFAQDQARQRKAAG